VAQWIVPFLRVIGGRTVAGGEVVGPPDVVGLQAACLEAYLASWTARGFSPVTIENDSGVLDRVLGLLGRPAWKVTIDDVDRVLGGLAADGLKPSTRRGYVQAFKGFHRFLQARKSVEIAALFGSGCRAQSMSSTPRGMLGRTRRIRCCRRPRRGWRSSSSS
jgi:hypothetical protein